MGLNLDLYCIIFYYYMCFHENLAQKKNQIQLRAKSSGSETLRSQVDFLVCFIGKV
jgi:hypothetical protein